MDLILYIMASVTLFLFAGLTIGMFTLSYFIVLMIIDIVKTIIEWFKFR